MVTCIASVGSAICLHERQRAKCKECVRSSMCEHSKRRTTCKICSPHLKQGWSIKDEPSAIQETLNILTASNYYMDVDIKPDPRDPPDLMPSLVPLTWLLKLLKLPSGLFSGKKNLVFRFYNFLYSNPLLHLYLKLREHFYTRSRIGSNGKMRKKN